MPLTIVRATNRILDGSAHLSGGQKLRNSKADANRA
jgi:hypothetical protein